MGKKNVAPEVDEVEAKRQRKAAKKAAAEAAEAEVEEAEVDEAEAKRQRKAAKKAAKAAQEAAAAEAEQEPEVDEAEAKKKRKAAKKAKAAAAAAAAEEEEVAPAEPKKVKKVKRAADADEDEAEVEAPKSKKVKKDDEEEAPREGKGKGGGKGNKEFEVFVGGLPFTSTEDVLKKDFADCGEIVAFRLPLNDEGGARGIAFIEYTDKESCDKALKFHDTEYGGRWISVRMSGDTSGKDGKAKGKGKDGKDKGKGKDGGKGNKDFEIFIGGLPYSTTEDVLRKDFAECGELVKFRMPLNDEGFARGIAFAEYTDKESCEKALKFHDTEYGGRYLSVRMSSDPPPPKGEGKGKDGKKGKGNKECEIFIGGLPFSCTEEALKAAFADCGEIVMLRMPLNDEGKPRGIAFMELKDKEACEKALKLNETEMDGRWLAVKMSGDGAKGKDGKDKGKGKGKKGKKGGMSTTSMAARDGAMVAPEGKKQTFEDSDSD